MYGRALKTWDGRALTITPRSPVGGANPIVWPRVRKSEKNSAAPNAPIGVQRPDDQRGEGDEPASGDAVGLE